MRKLIAVLCLALLTVPVVGPSAAQAAGKTDSRKWGPPLVYHGGPVMTKVKNYLVFWTGGNKKAFDSTYVSLLQRWQKDARHTTVFKSTIQYTQADGGHPTDTSYGGTFVDNSPFPGKGPCANVCVGEADIARMARTTAVEHKLKPGMTTIVYVYTPAGVQKCNVLKKDNTDCYDDSEGPNHNGVCGYHDHIAVGKSQLVFGYVPHPRPRCYLADGRQRFPNNKLADAAVNLTSFVQMEAITDPLYNAWYDSSDDGGAENGAECEFLFGPTLPGRKGNTHYDGHTYDVQAEASNKEEGCVVGSRVDGF